MASVPATADIYRELSPGRPVQAKGGSDRDLVALWVSKDQVLAGEVTIRLVPSASDPITLIAYNQKLQEAGRSISNAGEAVVLTLPDKGQYYLRVVPTGGAYDSPVGAKFRRSAYSTSTNPRMLAPYLLTIGGGADGPSASGPAIAAAPQPSRGGLFFGAVSSKSDSPAAPMSAAGAALTPNDRFGPLVYLAGHDWLVTSTCNGTPTKTVTRANWTGEPGSAFEQYYADGSVATWKVGKKPATLVVKMNTGGKATYQVEPTSLVTSNQRLEILNGKIVGSTDSCTMEYAMLQDGVYDEARAESVRIAAEEKANRPKKDGWFKALTKVVLFPAKVALVVVEAVAMNPGAFTEGMSSAQANNAYLQPSTPSDWAARLNTNQPAGYSDMGAVTHVAAPMNTPVQQARVDELERYKIREQMARGERPTTFGEDARASVDADNARREAEDRRAARERLNAGSTRNDDTAADAAETERKAEVARAAEVARKAEEARRAEEVAKAEKARKEKLAVEEAARKKREEEERIANAPVEWKEGVVLCEPAVAPSRNATCHGPLQTTYGTLGEQSGVIALQQACGGNNEVSELGQAAGYLAFGCGWGIHPSRTSSDMAIRWGVGFVPGRRTYHCSRKQTTVCTTN